MEADTRPGAVGFPTSEVAEHVQLPAGAEVPNVITPGREAISFNDQVARLNALLQYTQFGLYFEIDNHMHRVVEISSYGLSLLRIKVGVKAKTLVVAMDEPLVFMFIPIPVVS